MFSLLTLNIFHAFFTAFIVDFEQVNVSYGNDILDFLHRVNHQRKAASEIPLLLEFGQLHPLPNQTVGFFDSQYLWKESIAILLFLRGVGHQGKAASGITPFGWIWPVMSLVPADCQFL